jgi:small subunit ribosomal protein S6
VQATMSKYELALVVNAKIEDDARTEVIEKIKEMITGYDATITNVDEWGKKKLAYEIQKMKEGYYYFIQFEASTDVPAEIEQRLRIMEPVMRFLCVKQDA